MRGIVAAVATREARQVMENRHTRLPDEAEIAEINARHLISTPLIARPRKCR